MGNNLFESECNNVPISEGLSVLTEAEFSKVSVSEDVIGLLKNLHYRELLIRQGAVL